MNWIMPGAMLWGLMHDGWGTTTFALRGRVKNWNEERGMWALSVQALFTGMKGIKGIKGINQSKRDLFGVKLKDQA
jgi:hypothetical protein